MKPTWAEVFPKLYELYCESDQADEVNYFTAFDNALKMPSARFRYEQLEEELGQLDNVAWREFKQKALTYVTTKDSRRGYNQLFECFNEVKGFLYLKTEGCEKIHFIPEADITSPDLRACCGSSVVLLEVKSINKSDAEVEWVSMNSEIGANGVRHMEAREVRRGLDDYLKHKIKDTVSRARDQLLGYFSEGVKRRIVYLVINLDILSALDPRNYDDLAVYIQQQGDKQIEVVYQFL